MPQVYLNLLKCVVERIAIEIRLFTVHLQLYVCARLLSSEATVAPAKSGASVATVHQS